MLFSFSLNIPATSLVTRNQTSGKSQWRSFLALSLFLFSSNLIAQSEHRALLLAAIEKQESEFAGLTIESTYTIHESQTGGKIGKLLQETIAETTYDSPVGLLVRSDYTQVVCWRGGPKKYAASKESIAFNGRIGTILLRRNSKTETEGRLLNRGVVMPGRPNHFDLGHDVATGWTSTVYGASGDPSECLSALIRRTHDKTKVVATEWNGYSAIQVTIQLSVNEGDKLCLYFAPRFGYAFLGRELFNEGKKEFSMAVSSFHAPQNDFYLPRRIVGKLFNSKTGKPENEHKIEISKTTLHSQKKPTTFYLVDFPDGSIVEDQFTGDTFFVGKSFSGLEKAIDKQVEDARVAGKQAPPYTTHGDQSSEVQQAPWTLRPRSILFIVLGIGIFFGGAIQILKNRRLAIVRSIIVLIFIAIGSSNTYSQRYSTIVRELPITTKTGNCGVASLLFALRYHSLAVQVNQLIPELGCGPQLERPINLADMRNVLNAHKLSVLAFKDVSCDDLHEYLPADGLLILHLSPLGPMSPGHFIVVTRCELGSIYRIDAGIDAGWTAMSEFRQREGKRMSGKILSVQRSKNKAPLIRASETIFNLNLGNLKSQKDNVRHSIPFLNDSNATMKIRKVESSCSCFESASFDKGGNSIQKGETDILQLVFDTSKFSIGKSEQSILLTLESAGGTKKILVKVSAERKGDLLLNPIRVIPRSLYVERGSIIGVGKTNQTDITISMSIENAVRRIRMIGGGKTEAHLSAVEIINGADFRPSIRIEHWRIIIALKEDDAQEPLQLRVDMANKEWVDIPIIKIRQQ